MTETIRVQKNSFFYLISTFTRFLTNALLFIIVGRYYGPQIFGSFSSAWVLTYLFLTISDFGFDVLISSEIARNKDKAIQTFQRFYPSKILFSLLSYSFLIVLLFFIPASPDTKRLIYILSFNMLFTTITQTFFSLFKGIEQYQHEAKISLYINTILFIGIMICAYLQFSIYIFSFLIVILRFCGLILVVKKTKEISNFHLSSFSFNYVKNEIKLVLVFGLHLLFGAIYFQIDTILIMVIKGDFEAGLYQSVFKLITIILLFPEMIIGILLPVVVRLYSNKDVKWLFIIKLLFKVVLIVSLPIMLIVYSFPEEIILLLYKRVEFLQATSILKYASFLILIRFVAEPFALILTIVQKQKIRTVIVFAASLLNITLNLLFIPSNGIVGAMLISIFSNIFTFLLYISFTYKYLLEWIKDFRLLVTSILILFFGLIYHYLNFIPFLVIVPLTSIFYFIITFYINFNPEERKLLIINTKGSVQNA